MNPSFFLSFLITVDVWTNLYAPRLILPDPGENNQINTTIPPWGLEPVTTGYLIPELYTI